MSATIYYDGDCPFCARYTALLKLRDTVGPVALVNVREDVLSRNALAAEGFELDQGMVVDLDGRRYGGADAIHRLGLLSTGSNWFNRINAKLFSSPVASRLLYPGLRAGRNAVLFAIGRQRLQANSTAELTVFAIFSHAFGMYAVADFLYSIYGGIGSIVTYCFGVAGLYLIARPRSPRVFALLCAAMFIAAVAKMPTQSNHAILLTFALLAALLSACITWFSGRSWTAFMATFAPVGRALLLTMYFFGVFHKINTGFLDPSVSCAVALWKEMPWPLSAFDAQWWRIAMIYGTLFGEAAIFIGLLSHRTRHAAIMLGIAFHSMLALSNYGFYLAFSTLTIALHLLFLSPGAATRITSAPIWKVLQARAHSRTGLGGLIFWAGCLYALAEVGHFNAVTLLWLPWSIWLVCLVGKYGRERDGETTVGRPILSRPLVMNALSIFFVLNCFSPFLGLKNAQSMNMFANLTYEEGRSNHLLLPRAWPFSYARDSVKLLRIEGLSLDSRRDSLIPYYGVLDMANRNPNARFTFIRDGKEVKNANAASLAADMEELHPRWFRDWFHFRIFPGHGRADCERGS